MVPGAEFPGILPKSKQSGAYSAGLLPAGPKTNPAPQLASRAIDVRTGLPMAEMLGILRHLWFRGPDCLAPAHFAVWRHPEAIAKTVKYLKKHVKTSLIKITIYSAIAIASGRVRTTRDAVPSDKELLKLCHGNTGSTSVGGLSRAQFDVLRAYRGEWKWSPFMPQLEGTATRQQVHGIACQCRCKRQRGTNRWRL